MNVRFARFLAKKDFCHFGFDLLGIILQRAHEERVLDEGKITLCKQRIAVIELFFFAPEVLAVASQAEESKLLASSKPLLIPTSRALRRRRHRVSLLDASEYTFGRS